MSLFILACAASKLAAFVWVIWKHPERMHDSNMLESER